VKVTEGGEGGGAITLVIDQTSIKSGQTTFVVHNDATTEEHEMVLVKLKSADTIIPVVTAKHRVDESKLKSLGEVSELKPGTDGRLKANLIPAPTCYCATSRATTRLACMLS
jgi:uncharacterized cupredoxin-like copper-binding protein